MDRLQRVQFVVRRYPHLQGLRLVPLGILFLASGVWRGGQQPLGSMLASAHAARWFAAAFMLALIIAVALGRYYRARFGSVEPLQNLQGFLAAVGFVAILSAALWMQTTFEWDVSAPLVVLGAALAYVGVAGGYLRVHYLAVALGCMVLATLGMLGVSLQIRLVLLDYLIGAGLILVGIGDHVFLRNTLEPYSHARTV
jgi:hypothetical protein